MSGFVLQHRLQLVALLTHDRRQEGALRSNVSSQAKMRTLTIESDAYFVNGGRLSENAGLFSISESNGVSR